MPVFQTLLQQSKTAHQPNCYSIHDSRHVVARNCTESVTCKLALVLKIKYLNPVKEAQPKVSNSPLKERVNRALPLLTPPLSDMGPTLTYCGVGDRVTTTLPR